MTTTHDPKVVLENVAALMQATLGTDVKAWADVLSITPFGDRIEPLQRALQDDPGQDGKQPVLEFVQWVDAQGGTKFLLRALAKLHPETSDECKALLDELTSAKFTGKDFEQRQQQQQNLQEQLQEHLREQLQHQSAEPGSKGEQTRDVAEAPEVLINLPPDLPSALESLPAMIGTPATTTEFSSTREASEAPRIESLRLDTAVPERVVVGQAFKLAVSIRQLTSAIIDRPDLPVVDSGNVDVLWQPGQLFTKLRIEISAPDCAIDGSDSDTFKLIPGRDSPIFYYHLTPKRHGPISIFVTVYQEEDRIGTAGIYTSADDEVAVSLGSGATATRFAGGMQLALNSQPLDTLVNPDAIIPLHTLAVEYLVFDFKVPLEIAQEAGLDLAYIERGSIPAAQWWNVLAKAYIERRVPQIADRMKFRLAGRAADIDAALAAYTNAVATTP